MAKTGFIHIVGTSLKPGTPPEVEEEFNKWYNEVHVPMLLTIKGLTGVTRYKIKPTAPPGAPMTTAGASGTAEGYPRLYRRGAGQFRLPGNNGKRYRRCPGHDDNQ